jgi:hypothetical protein
MGIGMAANGSRAGATAGPLQGTYGNDEVRYLECKLILKPDRFTCVQDFHGYGALVRQAARECEIDFSTRRATDQPPKIREILFLDTADFKFYNNAFILRRRITYKDGFPVGDPEIVFKFRHPDFQRTATVDVRPIIPGSHRIKFKAEALPLREQLGGYRVIYSHNAQFGLSQAPADAQTSLAALVRIFPALRALQSSDAESIEPVNQAIVEEVLQEIGTLDFGHGVEVDADVALWRTRGEHKPLIGEFSFQCKLKPGNDLHDKTAERAKQLLIALQRLGPAWVSLGTTKTGVVYRLKGNPPQAHE